MIKLKLRKNVIPVLLILLGSGIIMTAVVIDLKPKKEEDNLNYVSNTILSPDIPVMKTPKIISNPYIEKDVKIGKNYYDYKEDSAIQENSIIYHENTYLQNPGIDFVHKEPFQIISILDGKVTNIKEDKLLGKIVEITHDNNIISVYQSLSDVHVKKDEMVYQGHVIGTSGTNELNEALGNHLHFEMYIDGNTVNPRNYLKKELDSVIKK